jgi:pilus assembly protein FimV
VVRVDKPVSLLRLVTATVLTLPLLAQAAGLGRLSVQSFLGQPLQAEIEVVSVQPGEEASLEARLASSNAFAQAGIEFNPALSTIQFALDKRDGRPVIRITTRQSVNEPFIDLLVELRWSTGLFVREYTVLLDPPGYEGPRPQPMAAEPATARAPPVTAAPSAPQPAPAATAAAPKPEAPSQEQTAATPSSDATPAAAQEDKPAAAPAAVPQPTQAPAQQAAQAHEVRKGDTLGEIALQYRPEGVSVHQMLIALQRANEDAFIRDNINLVRAGRILAIPDAQTAAAVDAADASRLVIAQHADFAEYRSRLGTAVAAAPAPAQAAERAAAGQITAKPDEPKPAAATDQLKLSKADPKKPGAPAAAAAREDDLAARQRALQEAQSRVTELEKNVADLHKLLEMRNQQLAQLEQKAAAKPAPAAKAPEPSPAAPTPAKPVAEAPKPAAAAPKPAAEAAAPVAQPVPAAKPKPKPRPMTPPPPPEPSLVDEFLGNPVALGGLGAVVLLLGGYGAWAWQRKKKSISKFQDSVLGPASVAPGSIGAEPGLAGAPSVSQSSVSQAAVGGMDTDDVDPIAEADVYMAYGRDAQAEEILKEALQKDPNRVAVLAKLLEIYANRRDAPSFEQHALKLKSVTHGTGAEWEKASALGRSVDPGNGLYGGGGVAPAAALAAPVAAAAPAVDFDIGGGTAGGFAPAAEAASALDLDLGGGAVPAEEKTDFSPSGTLIIDTQESKAAASGLDFDLGGGTDKADSTAGGLNFELPGASAQAAEPTPTPSSAGGGGLDFDLNLGGEAKADEAPAMDLSTISLDLGMAGDAPAAGAEANADPKWQEVATKLDLAKAYEEMGDKDGARELLNEVVREGDAAQQGQAQQLLAKLG